MKRGASEPFPCAMVFLPGGRGFARRPGGGTTKPPGGGGPAPPPGGGGPRPGGCWGRAVSSPLPGWHWHLGGVHQVAGRVVGPEPSAPLWIPTLPIRYGAAAAQGK